MPSGRTYAIRLDRVQHVGDKNHLVIDDERNDRTSAQLAGAATKKDENKFLRTHVDGTVALLELAPDGKRPLRDEMTVGDFWQSKDDGPKTPLAHAGAKVAIMRAAKKQDARVTVDGASASHDPLGDRARQHAHAAFGSERRRRVRHGVAVRVVDGVDCLDVQVEMHVGALQSVSDMPAGASIANGTIETNGALVILISHAGGAGVVRLLRGRRVFVGTAAGSVPELLERALCPR
jgi:hypothetical protein